MQARKRMLAVKQGKAIIARERLLRTKLPRIRYSYKRMAKQVEAELEAFKLTVDSKKDKNWTRLFFNNFRLRFPISGRRLASPEFARQIDAIVERMGINPDKITELQPNVIAKAKGFDSMEMTKKDYQYIAKKTAELCRLVLPVYIELRRRGYSHKKLCG